LFKTKIPVKKECTVKSTPVFSDELSGFSHIVLDKGGVLNIIGQPYRNVLKIRLLRRFKWELGKSFQGKGGRFEKHIISGGSCRE